MSGATFRLRECRLRAGMSREDLAVLVGWSGSKVARIENGHIAGFLWSDATNIAVALGCTLDELAGIEEPKLAIEEIVERGPMPNDPDEWPDRFKGTMAHLYAKQRFQARKPATTPEECK